MMNLFCGRLARFGERVSLFAGTEPESQEWEKLFPFIRDTIARAIPIFPFLASQLNVSY